MNRQAWVIQLVVSLGAALACVMAYHIWLQSTVTRFGIVDVAAVYRLKEKQLVDLVSKAGVTEEEKKQAMEMATQFAKNLPAALDQLPKDCKCVVLVRTAVAAETPNMVDLTPMLLSKIGI